MDVVVPCDRRGLGVLRVFTEGDSIAFGADGRMRVVFVSGSDDDPVADDNKLDLSMLLLLIGGRACFGGDLRLLLRVPTTAGMVARSSSDVRRSTVGTSLGVRLSLIFDER